MFPQANHTNSYLISPVWTYLFLPTDKKVNFKNDMLMFCNFIYSVLPNKILIVKQLQILQISS